MITLMILTVRGEPFIVVESVREVDELAHVELGQLSFQERLLQVQFGVASSLALALLASRLPGKNTPLILLSHRKSANVYSSRMSDYCLFTEHLFLESRLTYLLPFCVPTWFRRRSNNKYHVRATIIV